MARRNNRTTARVVRNERPRAETSTNAMGYPAGRERSSEGRERPARDLNLPRHALNDLYERSSF